MLSARQPPGGRVIPDRLERKAVEDDPVAAEHHEVGADFLESGEEGGIDLQFYAGEVVVGIATGDIEEVGRGCRVEAVGAGREADLHAVLTEIAA